ncbi:hypothetical protein LAJ19_17515 (plasmid) [Deinococcus taeanensis]|uniref:hypothetical protein n=1 Tax=Deinococcus taeanensis TaxID=2737050 RepID=UPI001CDBF625|nr:hypothetical protein [Deinococcus taeanensis]UBV44572.1 hypothetical protein LAJ19_17515 [Deinococcus taeanensis]
MNQSNSSPPDPEEGHESPPSQRDLVLFLATFVGALIVTGLIVLLVVHFFLQPLPTG